jgi:NAD(P)-dependent dehydrogenase (short-subunit alcohol dehydrogenase family)
MATVLVTGANRGIGLEYCRQLSVRGDDVIAVCREAGRELDS